MQRKRQWMVLAVALASLAASRGQADQLRIDLRDDWAIQSSANVRATGESLSRPGADVGGYPQRAECVESGQVEVAQNEIVSVPA